MLYGENSFLSYSPETDRVITKVASVAEEFVRDHNKVVLMGKNGLDAYLSPRLAVDSRVTRGNSLPRLSIGVRRQGMSYEALEGELDDIQQRFLAVVPESLQDVVEDLYSGTTMSGTNDFTMAEIAPTEDNAKAIRLMTWADLKDGGHWSARRIADPNNDEQVGQQIDKLTANPESYVGIFEDGHLVGFMKLTEWMLGDQLPYGTLKERWHNASLYDQRERVFEDRPLGIQGLGSVPSMAKLDREMIMRDLVDFSVFQADNGAAVPRRIVIPVHRNDQALSAITDAGFEPTRLTGRSVGMRQRLYEREAAFSALRDFGLLTDEFDR